MRVLSLKAAFSYKRGYVFDRMYFLKNEEEENIPKLFSTCLQMRIQGPNLDSLRAMIVDSVEKEGQSLATNFKITRDQAPENLEMVADFQASLINKQLEEWWCVVPLLLRSLTKKEVSEFEELDEEIRPRSRLLYLRNKNWDHHRDRERKYGIQQKPDIPDSAVLHVQGEKITPPCLACPYLSRHMSGGCTLGMKTCLTSMSIVSKSQYVTNLQRYGKEVDLAGLQEDDTQGD